MNDPLGELAQQLFVSEELETQISSPWGENPADNDKNGGDTAFSNPATPHRFGEKPHFVDIPPSAVKASQGSAPSGPTLLYNICAVLYVTNPFFDVKRN